MNLRIRYCMLCLAGLLCCLQPVMADNLPEYRLKAAFIYNFISFTEWPAGVGNILNLCVYGPDPFGEDLDALHGKSIAGRSLAVRRVNSVDGLEECQIIFISRPVIENLSRVIEEFKGKPVLTVADTPGAGHQGAIINMVTDQNRVAFNVNLGAARRNGLGLSSKLLRLAREVIQ